LHRITLQRSRARLWSEHAANTTDPEHLAGALDDALLRMWVLSLAHGADRPDVRKLASGLLVVLDETEHLRRAGGSAMIPAKVRQMLVDGLKAKGCQPPA
jgi:hypothetical protein